MNNLQTILDMWKEDSIIDEMALDESSRQSAKLHGKYLELLSVNKLKLKKQEAEFKVLLKDKWLHYNGKMSQEEIDEKGWDYNPLGGLTVLKGDMDYYYDSDPHIQELVAKIEYQQTLVDTLEEIMNVIRWRHSTIKNVIDWRRFSAGG